VAADVEAQAESFRANLRKLRTEIGRVIVGLEEIVEQVLITLLADGHALLEGVPGVGKTMLVKTLAQCLRLRYSRIQFTPDLMPADILGTNLIREDEAGRKQFVFERGPIFANLVLGDEINRATPKTQSALLECMQEKTVTVQGVRHALEDPFVVLATQNPIEMEGTFPLPEAQVDRFLLKIAMRAPSEEELVQVLQRTTGEAPAGVQSSLGASDLLPMRALARQIPVASHVERYVAKLVLATDPRSPAATPFCKKYLRYGASPRGAQAMLLAAKVLALMRGRFNVSFQDLRDMALPALRHRLIRNFEAEAEGIDPDRIVKQLLQDVPETTPR
jgi:MoxR-like ATPase